MTQETLSFFFVRKSRITISPLVLVPCTLRWKTDELPSSRSPALHLFCYFAHFHLTAATSLQSHQSRTVSLFFGSVDAYNAIVSGLNFITLSDDFGETTGTNASRDVEV